MQQLLYQLMEQLISARVELSGVVRVSFARSAVVDQKRSFRISHSDDLLLGVITSAVGIRKYDGSPDVTN